MKETFLHYIWETGSYYAAEWHTRDGQSVRVIDPGTRNHDQGPDFLHARVEIGGMRQYGHVEIHIDSRDWYKHRHQDDPIYNAVVLHVVLTPGAEGQVVAAPEVNGQTAAPRDVNGQVVAPRDVNGKAVAAPEGNGQVVAAPEGNGQTAAPRDVNGQTAAPPGGNGQAPILRKDGTPIPEVSLNGRIHAGLMQRSTSLDKVGNHPSCGPLLKGLPEGVRTSWLDRVAAERLERKLELAQAKLDVLHGDWEQAIWYDLAGFMAGPVNKEAFQTLATHLPIKILRRHQHISLSREALLFGMACTLIGEPLDPYMDSLQSEWKYQSALHQLQPAPIMLKLHRMRPANFPTVRLAQLGVLISHQSRLTELLDPDRLAAFCDKVFETPEYWQQHLRFGKVSKAAPKQIGYTTLRTILLNCLRPLSILYARAHGDRNWEAKSRNVSRSIAPENNRFIRAFEKNGLAPMHAEDGQAMIRLHQTYCQPLRCLECGIGKWVLQEPNAQPSLLPERKN